MSSSALILANGAPPSRTLLKKLLAASSHVFCADGGANTAARYGIRPDAIVGDLDSTTKQTLSKFRTVEIHRIVDDYSTDLEKTLAWVTDKGFTRITVAGATGGRLDHFVGNLSAMVKFSGKATVSFVDDTGEWVYIGRSSRLDLPVGDTISLIPLARCEGIVTQGLHWNLNHESLELGVRDATSNLVDERPVRISVASGNLILFHLFTLPPTRQRRKRKR